MARYVSFLALVLSLLAFAGQMFFFTHSGEQIAWVALGVAVYGLAVAKVTVPLGSRSTSAGFDWATVLGIVLGILPPSLRLGGEIDTFVLVFPVIHVALLGLFFSFARAKGPAPVHGPHISEKAAWRKRLLAELGITLATFGYTFVPANRSFRKETATGWQSIHLELIQHPTGFDVVVDVAMRLDEIQRQLDDDTDKAHVKPTIGCEYGTLLSAGQYRWAVTSADDVTPVARSIVKACKASLFPFFEKFSDAAMVYETLREDSRLARLLVPSDSERLRMIEAADALVNVKSFLSQLR